MKIREKLNKIRNKIYLLGFLSWLLIVASMVFSETQHNNSFSIVMLIPFGLFMAVCIYAIFGIRCPQCRGILSYAVSWPPGKWLNISEKIKFCQF
jgi:predicted Na+-dependent transporter